MTQMIIFNEGIIVTPGSNYFFKDYMWLHFQSRQFLNFIDVKLKSMSSILACLVL